MKNILTNFNFMILLLSRCASNAGSSLYSIAAMWLVYELSGSSMYSGLALFLTQMPALLQIVLGPVIDRFQLKKLLVFTQCIQVFMLLVLPLAYAFGFLTVALVLTVMPVVSLCNQFLYPAQLTLLPKILKKDQLTTGNSLFSVAYQGTDVLFTAFAGIIIAVVGGVAIFYVNSATFLFSALLLMQLRLPKQKQRDKNDEQRTVKQLVKGYGEQLGEGLRVLKQSFFSRLLIGILVVNFAIAGVFAILPGFSSTYGNVDFYGMLLAASGLGTIIGAACVSLFKLQRVPIAILYATLLSVTGLCFIAMAIGGHPAVVLLLFVFAFIPAGSINVIAFVMIQSAVEEHLLGRVMAAVMGIAAGIAPLGSLIGGAIGSWFSYGVVIVTSGLLLLSVALYWILSKKMRRLPATQELSTDLFQAG